MDLRISVATDSEIQRSISIEIPRAEYSKRFNDAVSKASSQARLKGFRPGKAPKEMIVKMYGTELHNEIMESFAMKGLRTALEEHKLDIVGRPEIKFGENNKDEDLKITAAVSIAPKPTVSKFKNLEIEVPIKKITDHDVEHELDHLRQHHAVYTAVEGRNTAQKGDFVTLEYDLLVDGEQLPGGKRETRFTELGSESGKSRLPADLEAALPGLAIGEEKDLTVAPDANYPDQRLAGKSVVYRTTITKIESKQLPALDDELAKKSGMAEDVAGLKSEMRKALEKSSEEQNTQSKERKLFEKLIELNPFELPAVMVDEEIRSILFEMGALDRRSEKSYQIDVSPFRQHLSEQAEYRVRSLILLDQIKDQEKVKPSDEEFEVWVEGLITKGGFKTRDELNKHLGLPASKDRLLEICARERMTEKLIEAAKITEVDAPDDHAGHSHD